MKTMRLISFVGALFVLTAVRVTSGQPVERGWYEEFLKNTADRVRDHGYPGEVHQVETEDNYLVTMFRIPYSHKLQNQGQRKPAVLLQHGLTSCSDAWILNGPNDALAFLLADAGYDVWMGNARGTRYSRNNTRLSPNHPYFWKFSWHEIGVYDMPAMIDYILETTGETAVHYTGHSQGTTVFFVLMSMRPEYNHKVKTAHLLAPVAFMHHMSTLLAKYTRRFVGRPNTLTRLLDTQEVMQSTLFFVELRELFCKNPVFQFMCSNLMFLVNGDEGSNGNMNMTISAHMNETHPAGCSTTQVLHYMQEYESGHFRQLDHGAKKNLEIYGRDTPPDYEVSLITNENLHFYYSDADNLAAVVDVEHLASLLPTKPNMYHVPDPTWTHSDFGFAYQVKEVINDRIIAACDLYEQKLTENSKEAEAADGEV